MAYELCWLVLTTACLLAIGLSQGSPVVHTGDNTEWSSYEQPNRLVDTANISFGDHVLQIPVWDLQWQAAKLQLEPGASLTIQGTHLLNTSIGVEPEGLVQPLYFKLGSKRRLLLYNVTINTDCEAVGILWVRFCDPLASAASQVSVFCSMMDYCPVLQY